MRALVERARFCHPACTMVHTGRTLFDCANSCFMLNLWCKCPCCACAPVPVFRSLGLRAWKESRTNDEGKCGAEHSVPLETICQGSPKLHVALLGHDTLYLEQQNVRLGILGVAELPRTPARPLRRPCKHGRPSAFNQRGWRRRSSRQPGACRRHQSQL